MFNCSVVRAGLHVEQFYSVQKDEIMVKIGADDDRLLDEAEHHEFLLPLDSASIESIARSTDYRDDVIKDRKTGKILKTVQRIRGPMALVERKGRRFIKVPVEDSHEKEEKEEVCPSLSLSRSVCLCVCVCVCVLIKAIAG
jgi:hypothetical protein